MMPKIIEDDWKYQLYNEDCFETFKRIPDGSIDLVLVDPPYGTTQNKWDSVIPLDRMWKELLRVGKSNCAFVFTSQTPFDKVLGCSQISILKYEWIWEKPKATGHLNVTKQPMKAHENVLVFYKEQCTYNPQKTNGVPYIGAGGKSKKDNYGEFKAVRNGSQDGSRYPRTVQQFQHEVKPAHPTAKPVPLMEYLIKTYSNEGNTVLDFALGSGTTGVACGNLNRKFIGCDSDKEHGYFQIAQQRIKAAYGVK